MNKFEDFGIKPKSKALNGEKIPFYQLFDKKITITGFRIAKSKYEKGNGERLDLEIILDGAKRISWTVSEILMDMIKQIPEDKFPFEVTIVKNFGRFEFK